MLALGRLPTLGLNKYTSDNFRDDTKNPFYVQKNTETMLVVRELEREFKDLNKFEKDNLKVFQKSISTRQDRAGAIREVSKIPPSNNFKPRNKSKVNTSTEETRDNAQNKRKLNIFDS
jgi:hypothetical protein